MTRASEIVRGNWIIAVGAVAIAALLWTGAPPRRAHVAEPRPVAELIPSPPRQPFFESIAGKSYWYWYGADGTSYWHCAPLADSGGAAVWIFTTATTGTTTTNVMTVTNTNGGGVPIQTVPLDCCWAR
jgi:hypothetical protein